MSTFQTYRCPNCGANIQSVDSFHRATCPFCDAELTVEDSFTRQPNTAPADFEIVGNRLLLYKGTDFSPVIPSVVQTICTKAFSQSSIVQMVLPNSVTRIEAYAFSDCPQLKREVIPESVTFIGSRAFCRCFQLSDVVLNCKIPVKADIFIGTPFCDAWFYKKRNG